MCYFKRNAIYLVVLVILCCVCRKEASGAHRCCVCKKIAHVICGDISDDEGYGSKVICLNCKTKKTGNLKSLCFS